MKNYLTLYSRAVAVAALLLSTYDSRSCSQGDGATISLLPTLGGSSAVPFQLNAAGQIAGYSFTAGDSAVQAFLFSGSTTSLGVDGSQGFALNSHGDVTGTAPDVSFQLRATLWATNGTTTDIGSLGGMIAYGVAINDAGQVAGDSITADGFTFNAFLFENGTLTALGDLGGGTGSRSADINQSGTIIGNAFTASLEDHGFYYVGGSMTDLGTLGGGYSLAVDINDDGLIVGESDNVDGDTHAFTFSGGTMTDLGTLGGTYSSALAVNSSNQIAGYSLIADDAASHAFLYSNGSMTDLGTLGGFDSQSTAINNLGHVVGWSDTASNGRHAVLWKNGTMTDLNTLLPANSGWVLRSADFINDAGRIVGAGELNGESATFILDLGAGGTVNNPPVAIISAPSSVECGNTILLDGSSSSDPDNDVLTYEWSSNGTVFGTNATLSASAALGAYNVTLKVTDTCGESSETSVAVNVVDSTAPTIGCPGQMEIVANASCQATLPDLTALVSISDTCSGSGSLTVAQSPAPGTVLSKGSHTITFTVTDAGNNSASCTSTVVVKDTTAPTILSAPGSLTAPANASCSGIVPVVGVNAVDNCSAPGALSVTQNPLAGSSVSIGSHVIVVTVTDESGNSTSTNVGLSVIDTIAPTIVSAPSVLNSGNCSAPIPNVVPSVVANDNCTASGSLVITQSPAAGTAASSGTNVITVTVQDASGNTATKQVLFVVADTTAPIVVTVSATPGQLSPPNHQMIPVTVTVVATDNCSTPTSKIISISANESLLPGEVVITGDLTASLAASKNSSGSDRVYTLQIRTTDAAGNQATGSVNVIVPKSNGNSSGGGKKNN